MTEIYRNNGLSIQVFDFPRTSILAGAVRTAVAGLDRPGKFMSASVSADGAALVNIASSIRKFDGTELVFGQEISMIVALINNDALAAQDIGAHVVVFVGF